MYKFVFGTLKWGKIIDLSFVELSSGLSTLCFLHNERGWSMMLLLHDVSVSYVIIF